MTRNLNSTRRGHAQVATHTRSLRRSLPQTEITNRVLNFKRRTNATQGSRIGFGGPTETQTPQEQSDTGSQSTNFVGVRNGTQTTTNNLPRAFPHHNSETLNRQQAMFYGNSRQLLLSLNRVMNGEAPAASRQAREQLPSIVVTEDMITSNADADWTCTICQEDIKCGDLMTVLSCGHRFHRGTDPTQDDASKHTPQLSTCRGIMYWLSRSNTCPHCREQLEPEYNLCFPSYQSSSGSVRVSSSTSNEMPVNRDNRTTFQEMHVPVSVVAPILRMQRTMIQQQVDSICRQQRYIARLEAAISRSSNPTSNILTTGAIERVPSPVAIAQQVIQSTLAEYGTLEEQRRAQQHREVNGAGINSSTREHRTEQRVSRGWQNPPRDLPERMRVVMDVMEITREMFLQARERAGGPNVASGEQLRAQEEQRLYLISKKIEAHLYRSSLCSSEYNNRVTLANRVARAVRHL